MAKPYSPELREAIVQAIANGRTQEQAAKDYEVSLSTVQRLLKRWRLSGNVRPDKFGGHKPYALKRHEELVKGLVYEQEDATLKQLRARLLKQDVVVSKSSLARFLDHLYPETAAARRAGRKSESDFIREFFPSRDAFHRWMKAKD